MAWIESHQSLATHRKLFIFRRSLNVRVTCAIGMLHLLWWWCLDNASNGDLAEISDNDLREICHWEGDGKKLVDALVSSGFLDQNRRVHNWKRYAGKLIEAREKAKKRMRTLRERSPNVPRTCANVPGDDTRTFAATVPNPTVPNRTKAESPPTPQDGWGFPATEAEALKAMPMGCQLPQDFVVKTWTQAMARGGRDSKDVPIRDFARHAATCWTYEQDRIAKAGRPAPRDGNPYKGKTDQQIIEEAMG